MFDLFKNASVQDKAGKKQATIHRVFVLQSHRQSYTEQEGRVEKLVAQGQQHRLNESLGFRNGISSVHSSRTMMLAELSLVFEHVGSMETPEAYVKAIVEENILGKPTQTTRKRTAQRLAELYSLDQSQPVFRLLRRFWSADDSAHPLLAYLAATARDPLLRDATLLIVEIPINSVVRSPDTATHLKAKYPSRFSAATLISTAQNLAASWTQAGYLTGRLNKKRTRPVVTPVVVTYALLLGHLNGTRGKMLLDTIWMRMLDRAPAEIADLATEASKQGWMNYKAAGSVVEITFPGLLTPQEEKASYEPD